MGCPVNGPGEAKHADFGIAGAICGAYVSLNIDTAILRKIYSVFLVFVGGYMCISTVRIARKTS